MKARRRTGYARDVKPDFRDCGNGAWIFGGTDYRRTFFRCKPRRVDRPCIAGGAVGGPIALVEEGDLIKINIPELKLELAVSDEELLARKAKWQPREPKVTTGYLKRYASLVTSGNRGAILALPEEQ